jgi:hypothetical protein
MEISLSKSFVHIPDCLTVGEICKRVFLDGVEITSLPPKAIISCINDPTIATQLQDVLYKRGNSVIDTAQYPAFFIAILGEKHFGN